VTRTSRFRVLAAQQQPDHATIARFVERHEHAIAGLFGEVLTLICAGVRVKRAMCCSWSTSSGLGGAWARWRGGMRCARAPGLISVRDLAVRWAGDVMVDGVFPRDAVRPLGLWRPSTGWWRQRHAGSRPRCIGVSEGRARTDAGQAGIRPSSPSSRRVWKLRLSSLRATARQARLPPSRAAVWT